MVPAGEEPRAASLPEVQESVLEPAPPGAQAVIGCARRKGDRQVSEERLGAASMLLVDRIEPEAARAVRRRAASARSEVGWLAAALGFDDRPAGQPSDVIPSPVVCASCSTIRPGALEGCPRCLDTAATHLRPAELHVLAARLGREAFLRRHEVTTAVRSPR